MTIKHVKNTIKFIILIFPLLKMTHMCYHEHNVNVLHERELSECYQEITNLLNNIETSYVIVGDDDAEYNDIFCEEEFV